MPVPLTGIPSPPSPETARTVPLALHRQPRLGASLQRPTALGLLDLRRLIPETHSRAGGAFPQLRLFQSPVRRAAGSALSVALANALVAEVSPCRCPVAHVKESVEFTVWDIAAPPAWPRPTSASSRTRPCTWWSGTWLWGEAGQPSVLATNIEVRGSPPAPVLRTPQGWGGGTEEGREAWVRLAAVSEAPGPQTS